MIDTLLQDVRFAVRTLAKAPTFTAAVVATIAIGLGATTAIFTIVNAILLRPLPFPDSERTVMLCETNASIGNWCGASPMNVADWARLSPALDSAGVARPEGMLADTGTERYGVHGGIVSPGFFKVLRTRPLLGRLIEDRDMAVGANHVVVLSYAFWQKRLGGDRRVVGRTMVFDKEPFTVVGVLPQHTYIPVVDALSTVAVWKPLTTSIDDVSDRGWRGFVAMGRLADGASSASLATSLDTIRASLAKTYPKENANWGLRLVNLRTAMVGDISTTLWIFLGAVALVLLIACANVASLLLVRATGRGAEFAVRASLGAGRARLVQQLVTESLVLALAGGALGLLVAIWATPAFVALAPDSIPRLTEITIDSRVVIFAFLLSAATAVVFGVVPARRASKANLNDTLRGARVTQGAETRLRSTLVVVEVALALMLLVATGLLTRTYQRLTQWDPGFERDGLVTAFTVTPAKTTAEAVPLLERARDEVASVPGVRAVALASAIPLIGGTETGGLSIEGRAPFAPGQMPTIEWFDVSRQFFDALGVRLLRGRAFAASDDATAPKVAIVNDAFAQRFFPGENPIGRRVKVHTQSSEIVGVVASVRPFRPDQPTPPQIYWPIEQYRRLGALLVMRTAPGVPGVERAVKARVSAIAAGMQVGSFSSLDEAVGEQLVKPRFTMLLVGAFAFVALLLAAVGVYGVMAHTVASRTREIGVRIALGATPRHLTGAVVGRGMALTAIGIAGGCLAALATSRVLESLLYGLQAIDPLSIVSAVALFALVALAACYFPARRASRMDPITALRVE